MSTTCEFINVAQHMANTSESFQLASKENKLNFIIFFLFAGTCLFLCVSFKNKKNIKLGDFKEKKKIVEGHEWPQMFYLF